MEAVNQELKLLMVAAPSLPNLFSSSARWREDQSDGFSDPKDVDLGFEDLSNNNTLVNSPAASNYDSSQIISRILGNAYTDRSRDLAVPDSDSKAAASENNTRIEQLQASPKYEVPRKHSTSDIAKHQTVLRTCSVEKRDSVVYLREGSDTPTVLRRDAMVEPFYKEQIEADIRASLAREAEHRLSALVGSPAGEPDLPKSPKPIKPNPHAPVLRTGGNPNSPAKNTDKCHAPLLRNRASSTSRLITTFNLKSVATPPNNNSYNRFAGTKSFVKPASSQPRYPVGNVCVGPGFSRRRGSLLAQQGSTGPGGMGLPGPGGIGLLSGSARRCSQNPEILKEICEQLKREEELKRLRNLPSAKPDAEKHTNRQDHVTNTPWDVPLRGEISVSTLGSGSNHGNTANASGLSSASLTSTLSSPISPASAVSCGSGSAISSGSAATDAASSDSGVVVRELSACKSSDVDCLSPRSCSPATDTSSPSTTALEPVIHQSQRHGIEENQASSQTAYVNHKTTDSATIPIQHLRFQAEQSPASEGVEPVAIATSAAKIRKRLSAYEQFLQNYKCQQQQAKPSQPQV